MDCASEFNDRSMVLSDTRVRSKKYQLIQTQTDGLVGSFEASTASILWGELFTEKDRSFLRQHLEEGNLSFGAKDTFQLEYRIVWNPEAKKQIRERGETKDGKLVILLHGYGGRITNSWGWVKMVKSLWKQHFTVCLLDMPGFGRSSVNMSWNTPLQEWLHMDAVILAKFINGMNFRKSVSFIAYRESCASVMKLCTDSPHLVGPRQILVDPVFTLDDIFPIEAPYGAQMDWFQEEKPSMQAVEMDRMISRKSMNFWVSFTGAPGCTSALESFKLVMRARPHLGMRINITHLSKEFICEARAGAKVSTELLFICKYIKDRFSLYLAGIEKVPKEIPPWALDVVSTNASTAIGSKAVPSVDSPAGRARNFNALETVQEAAEVLSRHTTAENFFPASKRRESGLKEIPEEPIRERFVAPKRNLPMLAGLMPTVSGDQQGLSGFEALQSIRMDGTSNGFRDRSKSSKQKPGALSRYGASFMEGRSEALLREERLRGHLPSLSQSRSTQAMQRTAHGVVVCRPGELPPPPFKTEASRCAINSCAKKATQKRIEDPEIGRHRLICPQHKTKDALDAVGYRATHNEPQTVQEVLNELKGKLPNF